MTSPPFESTGPGNRLADGFPSRIVVTAPYSAGQRARLTALFQPAETVFLPASDRAGLCRELPSADIAILKTVPDSAFLDSRRLRWVHCNRSGLDACATRAFVDSPLEITSASGRSAAVLAEHALFFILSLAYNSAALLKAQHRRAWGINGSDSLRGLEGRKVLVIGMGHTARALVPRCLALDMQVQAFRRRNVVAEGLDIPVASLAAGDSIESLLPDADIIVLAASLNDASHGMIGERQFRLLKPGAMLVNVARASLVDTGAMKAALQRGQLAAAGLDVTEPEPLPPWDWLWRQDNVLITPHVTPRVADREGAEIDIIEDNFHRLLAGTELRNRLRPENVYTRGKTPGDKTIAQRMIALRNRLLRPTAKRI